VKLRIHQVGKDPVEVEIDKDELTFGRSSECDVVLSNPYISKAHVRLLRGLVLHDLESINGTFVAGKRVSTPEILHGTKFSIGPEDVTIEVVEADETSADSSRPLLAMQAENAGLQHELEELRAQTDFLQLQVKNLMPSEDDGPDAELNARRDQGIEEIEKLQQDYAELLNRLHQEIDELLEPEPAE